jgi:hypothetical protein
VGRVILVVFPAEKTENLYPFAFQSKVNSLLLNLALATWRELPAPSISRRRSEDACEHSFVGSVCDFANNTPCPTPAHSRALFAEAEARAEKPRVACSSSRFQPAFVVAQQKIGCKFLFGIQIGSPTAGPCHRGRAAGSVQTSARARRTRNHGTALRAATLQVWR